MFDGLNQWTWVVIAWLELLLAYGGYLLYLRARAKRLEDDE